MAAQSDDRQTKGWIRLARRNTPREARDDPATEWLKTHTVQDIRELAQELSSEGEDVSELVAAVNELEDLLAQATADNEEKDEA